MSSFECISANESGYRTLDRGYLCFGSGVCKPRQSMFAREAQLVRMEDLLPVMHILPKG